MDNNIKVQPKQKEHWENKFRKAVQILVKCGYSTNDLIIIIQEMLQETNQ